MNAKHATCEARQAATQPARVARPIRTGKQTQPRLQDLPEQELLKQDILHEVGC